MSGQEFTQLLRVYDDHLKKVKSVWMAPQGVITLCVVGNASFNSKKVVP